MSIWDGILNVIDDKIDIIDGNVDDVETLLNTVDGKIDTVDAFHDVPTQNSVDNVVMSDVIGNKTDGHTGNSLYGKIKTISEHIHHIAMVYPELAVPITLTKDAGAWAAYLAPTEIVPVNTITEDFDIHFLNISGISANGNYTLRLYSGLGGAEVLIGVVSFTRNAVQSQEGSRPVGTPLLPANTRISAAISGSPAGAETAAIKLAYHTY